MSILIDKHTRVLVQGITGKVGSFHAQKCIEYGTVIAAGQTPGKGGQLFNGKIPIYNTVAEAVMFQGVTASLIFVPPAAAADAILEAIDARIPLIICITEGIPVNDMLLVKERLAESHSLLVGPNCSGVITPGQCKMGIMPGYIHRPGKIGVLSRSGTLAYETVWQLTERGHGQSTCVGIGGDPIGGMSHLDVIRQFNEDPNTAGIIMIGEIGGDGEERATEYIRHHVKKPVSAFIAGQSAPEGRKMGHAGAIMCANSGSAAAKIRALENAGIPVARSPEFIADTFLEIYSSC